MSGSMETLNAIREFAGPRQTLGIDDATLERFLAIDPSLGRAIDDAGRIHEALKAEFGDLLADLTDVQHSFEESRSADCDFQQVYCIQRLFMTSSECNTTHHFQHV